MDEGGVDIARLRAAHGVATHGIYLGEGRHGWVHAGIERSTLVLGPSRSGKTSSLVIPNLVLAEGPAVSTSTKPDVLHATAAARGREGWTFLYDPSGEIERPKGVEPIGWSPLATATRWDAAVQTADAMVRASRIGEGGFSRSPGEHHWTERAGALLAPILHAAALESLPMRTVVRWIDRRDGATPLDILSATVGNDATATDLLSGIVGTDAREQSGIWSTTSGVLAAYRAEGAMASTELPSLDTDAFCRGPHTIYICSPGRRQTLFAPLVVGVIGDVRDATYDRERAGEGGRPTLLALDEMANIAPIPDVAAMVSEGVGQGLLVLACLQDLSQARSRWGPAADGFLSLFGTSVVLPGIADASTLRILSALGGDHEVLTTTRSHAVGDRGRLRPSSSVSTVRVPRYPVDAISRGAPGCALVVGPRSTLSQVSLTPAHAREPWRRVLAPSRARPGPEPAARGR
ncbi:MAG: type IV secretory system conjugative DNA transfer family protein [Acidimicrobiales bacterium]